MWSLTGVLTPILLFFLIHVKAETARQIEKRLLDDMLLLDDILSPMKYDPKIRPENRNGSGPIIVRVNTYVRSISDIDDINMEFSVQLTFRQEWNDKRLKYSTSERELRYLTLMDPEKVWRPDIFFSNEKEAHFHDVTVPNVLLRIYPNGDVLYSQRLSLKLACPLDLRNYPMDRQVCSIIMASYGYTTADLELLWKAEDPVQFSRNLNMLKFSLDSSITDYCTSRTTTGEYSCVNIALTFVRHINYYITHVYIPSTLIVLLSWIPFWLGHVATTARFSFGGAILLTITLIMTTFNMKAPVVSYITSIDVYLGTCFVFLFSALIEYALVTKFGVNEDNERNIEDKSVDNALENNCLMNDDGGDSTKLGKFANRFPVVYIRRWLKKYSSRAHKIDVISRFLFPVVYVLFNIVYWSSYAPNLSH